MGSGRSKPLQKKSSKQNRKGDHSPPSDHGLASYFRQALVKVHDANAFKADGRVPLAIAEHYDGLDSEPIGAGAFGEVRIVTHKDRKKKYACKSIRIPAVNKEKRAELMKEIEIMRRFDHPNVIKVIEVFVAPAVMHIVMEKADGGELFDKLADELKNPSGRFTEDVAKNYMKKMLSALNYLHSNKIAHRDLKLENFLLSGKGKNEEIKLIDFGYSREYLETTREKQLVGTPYYMPPEIFEGQYDPFIADVWSLGCILFMMVTGELPVSGKSASEIFTNIKELQGDVKPRKFGRIANKVVDISPECQDLINKMMELDTAKRITIPDCINHSWFTSRRTRRSNEPIPEDDEAPYNSETALKITKFKEFPDLKRAALMVAAFYLPEGELEALGREFVAMDKDGNGVLSYDEFHEALAMKLKAVDPNCDVKEHFDAVDIDNTMCIQYTEFIASCVEEQKVQQKQSMIMTAFKTLDMNSDGKISKDELRKHLGDNVSADDIKIIIAECDVKDYDGFIDQEEFEQAIRGGRLESLSF